MTRIARVSWVLFLIVATNGAAQKSPAPTKTEVCTPEDYAIYAAALNYFFARLKPERVMLRDRTATRLGSPDPLDRMAFRDVPEEATVDFDSRNKTQAKIEKGQIKTPLEINLLGRTEEQTLISNGGGCDQQTPLAFVSRPGLDAEHKLALISVGTSCYDHEWSTVMLLEKDSSGWKVLSRLLEDSVTIDRFPSNPAPPVVKIVSVQQIDSGDQYLMRVSFMVPDVPNETFDTIRVYGMRIVGTQRSDDRDYPTLHGSWKPNAPVEFAVQVPKEFTNPSKGWNLTFCVGTTAACYPSSNLLKLASGGSDIR